MIIRFPPIVPSSREFTAGTYPVIAPELKGVRRFPRLGGTTPSDFKINFEFANITDAESSLIIDCYKQTYGGCYPVTLRPVLFRGILFETLVTSLTGRVKWYFSQQPVIEAVYMGYSTAKVSLKGIFG